jgi:hypothetical protein
MGCPRGWSSVIEASFQRGKGEVGMDEYQVRTWVGIELRRARLSIVDQRGHLRRNIRLCVTPCPTISCMAMKKRANIAYLI